MKILYSCLSKSWGGMEMFAVTACIELQKKGHEAELICYPGTRMEEDAVSKGVKVHPLKASGYFNPVSINKLAGIIRKGGFDVVHTQYSKDLWVLVPALRLAGSNIPLLMTKQLGSFVVKKDFLHRWVYKRLDYALAISKVIEKNLLDTCPLDESKVLLLHNAVDTNKFAPVKANRNKIREEFGYKNDDIVVGMLARFSQGKGHEDVLYAAKQLIPEFNNLRFMIVGEPSRGEDDYGNKILSMHKEYELEDKVKFTGFRNDTPDIISAMDIFAFPSHNEAFGIALAEAMAMGKPVVAAAADGVLDINVDGETGWFFEAKNKDDLTEKLRKLILSPKERKIFGINARKRIIEHFDLALLTDKAISIYKAAIKKKEK